MLDLAAFLVAQAEASTHIQFVYNATSGQIEYVNAAYEHVLSGQADQVTAELPALLARLHPDDRAYLAHCWTLWVRGQLPDEIEVRLLRPDDASQWFCLTPFHQQTADGSTLVGGTLRDTTAIKHYQENSDRFNVRKNATLEILSHDMSGAFVLVQQIAEFLREEVVTQTNSRVPDMLRVLEATSAGSVKMIREFIDLEFLTSANTDLKRDRVELGAVLSEPLADLLRSKALLGQHFTYSLPPNPIYVSLDVNKFTQVVTNLLGNALKFTPDGKLVQVVVEPGPGSVRLHVIDEGIGIPAHLQPHLFEPFTKARRAGLRGEPTTGLGLALCQTIVEWHKGTLTVVSVEGEGTTFTVEVPQTD